MADRLGFFVDEEGVSTVASEEATEQYRDTPLGKVTQAAAESSWCRNELRHAEHTWLDAVRYALVCGEKVKDIAQASGTSRKHIKRIRDEAP